MAERKHPVQIELAGDVEEKEDGELSDEEAGQIAGGLAGTRPLGDCAPPPKPSGPVPVPYPN